MKNIWKNYKEIIVIFAYFLIIAGLFLFVMKPLFSSIEEKRNHKEEQLIDQKIKQKKVGELPEYKNKIEMINQNKAEMDVFIDPEYALPLIELLEKMAEQTGNTIQIDVVEESKSELEQNKKAAKKDEESIKDFIPGENFLTMNIVLNGEFNNIMFFLKKLENMKYFSDIISIKIENMEEEIKNSSIKSDYFLDSENKAKDENVSVVNNSFLLKASLEAVFYKEK
ncbi:MAG: hypothetical protein ACD_11C00072G0011 [uncultured bacterium]|nr:MAG: hypothetical protein ACD_11C00072G0011 [uncultured bacterium]HBR71775.1 hypothetical protein [Candidatus Moranbacteria bacterium]